MICVHCKHILDYDHKDYVKVVTTDKTSFYHGQCFSEVYQKTPTPPAVPQDFIPERFLRVE